MKVAIIHYWLVTMRGGEKVLEALCRTFPQADIFTHAYSPQNVSPLLRQHQVKTTWINQLPLATRLYKSYLPLMPMALEELDLSGYDLIISSESGPAKGIVPPPNALHICYCHSPMRYIWNMYCQYRKNAGFVKKLLMPPIAHYLRTWDVASAARVDHFIANSKNVAARIEKYYRRPAEILHPPVDLSAFQLSDKRGDYYLFVGELIPYKRPELAIEACKSLKRPLKVVGGGEQLKSLRKYGDTQIEILGPQPADRLRALVAGCRALIFPGEEDFGIVPLEAMASGRPVIALGKGGALETVLPGQTGLFFEAPTLDDLKSAIQRFESIEDRLDPSVIRNRAQQFSTERFQGELGVLLSRYGVALPPTFAPPEPDRARKVTTEPQAA